MAPLFVNAARHVTVWTFLYPLTIASLSLAVEDYNIPNFSVTDLRAGRRVDDLSSVLGSTGLIAITGLGVDFSKIRKTALESLCSCSESSEFLVMDGSDRTVLNDRLTTRTTLATATMSNIPLPLPVDQLTRHCGLEATEAMNALRDHVALASSGFVSALDRMIDGAASSSESQVLLRDTQGGMFTSISSIVDVSSNLEHFHVYSKEDTNGGQHDDLQSIDSSLDTHTDAGLFLSFVPARSCVNEANEEENSSFFVSVSGEIRRAVFPPGSVAIMLGVGAEHWLKVPEYLSLKATRHAVKMRVGEARAWYGMMNLVPENAIVHDSPVHTFADMRANMVMTGSNIQNRRYSDSTASSNRYISIGCGSSSSSEAHHSISSSITSPPKRVRLQMVPDSSYCNNSTNFYCWMSCLAIPDYENAEEFIKEGKSLYCLQPAVLASSGNDVKEAVEPCNDEQTGRPGGAMNSNCMGTWATTDHRVSAQKVEFNATNTGSADQPYCYGATSMFMEGFQWQGSTCVVYLFPAWTLTTHAAFVGACFGTFFFGFALEAVIKGRRSVAVMVQGKIKRLAVSTLFYGLQLTMGYMLMLVVMTYSVPLFLCIILGLMTGHFMFNINTKNLVVAEGSTPCCQNDLGKKKTISSCDDMEESLELDIVEEESSLKSCFGGS
eukprot:CAMPEP_0195521334 /NCGR_PEP_ID=MMETSP0794_2-20130614/18474_1 /TAXON_ID=515487 /ORGANISM="Stephanopyxis turris, Strain CCMP 815" /LENGTH=664 /DNA_ID=CAMNT_0040650863 /DNA_START=58 /DNA_END=2052 /DNA_ORIENTATION=+